LREIKFANEPPPPVCPSFNSACSWGVKIFSLLQNEISHVFCQTVQSFSRPFHAVYLCFFMKRISCCNAFLRISSVCSIGTSIEVTFILCSSHHSILQCQLFVRTVYKKRKCIAKLKILCLIMNVGGQQQPDAAPLHQRHHQYQHARQRDQVQQIVQPLQGDIIQGSGTADGTTIGHKNRGNGKH
jgi:hypothetical protein